mmetsp:Transcript_168191/g.540345  ORF Transcript_168191/g.540345 Transcript_168191/m.540345 type:complete len:150 (+) Transcript_168191:223-672(+)
MVPALESPLLSARLQTISEPGVAGVRATTPIPTHGRRCSSPCGVCSTLFGGAAASLIFHALHVHRRSVCAPSLRCWRGACIVGRLQVKSSSSSTRCDAHLEREVLAPADRNQRVGMLQTSTVPSATFPQCHLRSQSAFFDIEQWFTWCF